VELLAFSFPEAMIHRLQVVLHSFFILLKYDWLTLWLKMNTLAMDTQKMEPNQKLRFLQKDQLALTLVARKEC